MSKTNTTGGKSLKAAVNATKTPNGELEIIRASKLAEEGKTGVVAKGTYEKSVPNKFDAKKKDYFIRDTKSGTLYILNETQTIREQMELAEVGMNLEVHYLGKRATKNGKGFHDFDIVVA